MRGFRFIGRADLVSSRDYDPGDLLFFSPSADGGDWRGSGHGLRARDFDLFMCQTAIATGACPSDFVFVPTALGENAFDREPTPENVS